MLWKDTHYANLNTVVLPQKLKNDRWKEKKLFHSITYLGCLSYSESEAERANEFSLLETSLDGFSVSSNKFMKPYMGKFTFLPSVC